MISRSLKEFYYKFFSPFLGLNGLFYRYFRTKPKIIKVQLGPGQKNYLFGWLNLDANIFTKIDLAVDLRKPLPFHDHSVECMYSFHVIEHLPDLKAHFTDVHRCLKKGGFYRFGGPNGDMAINRFVNQDFSWFSDFPDKRVSLGGRFENFIFCRGEHLTILLESYLKEILESIGFTNVQVCLPVKETGNPDLFADCLKIEYENNFQFPHTLVLEATK